MGLNMYLTKTKKVEGFKVEDYFKVDNVISDSNEIDLEKETGLQNANELLNQIKLRGKHFQWYSIFSEVGYWRKANQIHKWFVKHVQNNVDDCGTYEVSVGQLRDLLALCKAVKKASKLIDGQVSQGQRGTADGWETIYGEGKIIEDSSVAEELLPTGSGFFFGSTDYNEYYMQDINATIKIINKVLKETDFETHGVAYSSSW